MQANSTTLGIIDAVGATAIVLALPSVQSNYTRIALMGFAAYAAYGAYKHLSGELKVLVS
jgi:hypothetical protein